MCVAELARDALHDTDKHQVVGAFISPVNDKYQKTNLAAASHRLQMCRLAVAESDWIQVDDWEATHEEYQLTAQVLASLQGRLHHLAVTARVILLAGADLIQSFAIPNLWSVDDVPTSTTTVS